MLVKKQFTVKLSAQAAIFLLTKDAKATLLLLRIYVRGRKGGMAHEETNTSGWAKLTRCQWLEDTGFSRNQYDRTMRKAKIHGYIEHKLQPTKNGGQVSWVRLHPDFLEKINTLMEREAVGIYERNDRGSGSHPPRPTLISSTEAHLGNLSLTRRDPTMDKLKTVKDSNVCKAALPPDTPSASTSLRKGFREEKMTDIESDTPILWMTDQETGEVLPMLYTREKKKKIRDIDKKPRSNTKTRKQPIPQGVRDLELLWTSVHAEVAPDRDLVAWSNKTRGMVKELLVKVPADKLAPMIRAAIGQWPDAAEYVRSGKGLKTMADHPSIECIAACPQEFADWFAEEVQESQRKAKEKLARAQKAPDAFDLALAAALAKRLK